jgi:hypothetical protein
VLRDKTTRSGSQAMRLMLTPSCSKGIRYSAILLT